MLLDAIDHVQIAMPTGGEELACWFYEEILGVPEVPKPPHLAVRGGCWFESGIVRIHLGVQDDFVPASKAHPAFAVADLDRLEANFRERGVLAERVSDPVEPDVVYAQDPFGNRLEFRAGRPVADVSDYTPTIVDVARLALGPRFADQLAFVQELDRLRTVERQSFIVDGLRRENTAEHSWHVAMLAAVLAEYAAADVDLGRVLLLLLVHDIVEIDAGDTGIYDTAEAASKDEREAAAADRLFGLLPDDVGRQLRGAWEEYEAAETADGQFARVFDRLAPFLLNLSASGVTWRRWGVTAADVREVMRPVGEVSSDLGHFVETMIDHAVTEGMLPSGESGIILPGRDGS